MLREVELGGGCSRAEEAPSGRGLYSHGAGPGEAGPKGGAYRKKVELGWAGFMAIDNWKSGDWTGALSWGLGRNPRTAVMGAGVGRV